MKANKRSDLGKRLSLLLLFLMFGGMVFLLSKTGEEAGTIAERASQPLSSPSDPESFLSFSRPAVSEPQPQRSDGNAPASAPSSEESAPDAIPGERVLMFYDDTHLREFLAIAKEEGLDVLARIDALHAVRIRVRDAAPLDRALRRAPAPTMRGPNLIVRPPDPPEPPEGVTYRGFGESAAAWLGLTPDRSDWGKGMTVAVLDTTVSAAVTEGVVARVNLVDEPKSATPSDHGTAVASIIVGGDDLTGVAPGVNLLAVRVMHEGGIGDTFTLAQGVMEAVDRGARVINMSLGSLGDTPVMRQAIAYAQAEGAVVVAAAGNSGQDAILYPARYPGVLAVGAVDADGVRMYFSNWGETLDLVAPGLAVTAEGADGDPVAFSGTSAAAPFVAGAVAGVWSTWPDLTAEAVTDLLVRYADDAGAPGRDAEYGAGVLNVRRVMERETPGIVDMVMVRPYVRRDPVYKDELIVTVFGQNRGTEPLGRVTLTANVDGAPLNMTFYDVRVGAVVQQDMRLTRAGIGERSILIDQAVDIPDREDRTPGNNRMHTTLSLLP